MSSRYPTTVSFSLEEFSRHGGLTGPHKDGWGIAFYEEEDVRFVKEAGAASKSACVDFIRNQNFLSTLVISHIRFATQGGVKLKNTQPFCRELGGRMHVFAHNGDLKGIEKLPNMRLGMFQPIGETDSEYAFCYLMHMMQQRWFSREVHPDLKSRYEIIQAFAFAIKDLGPANFLYSDGEFLFVHGHKRRQPGKEGFHPPGLHYLCRTCSTDSEYADFKGINLQYKGEKQKVLLIATVPLSEENWTQLEEGQILVVHQGTLIDIH